MSVCRAAFEFLGTMAGNQSYLWGMEKKPTYSRIYDGGAEWLRQQITEAGTKRFAKGFKDFGEEYSFTPFCLRDGRPFGYRHTSMQGGGFFLTLEEFNNEKTHFTNFDYALNKLQSQLELCADIPMAEILAQCSAYGINYILNRYFECVSTPEEGDLVVYLSYDTPTHAGLYRKSERNWNSPSGGTVESKWEIGFVNPYVFQHDVFFLPKQYGNIAKFYRVKKHNVMTTSPSPLHAQPIPSTTMDSEGRFHFVSNETNIKIRKEIDHLYGQELVNKFPQIELVKDLDFAGKCHNYAFGKILKTYSSPENVPLLEGNQNILDKYFTPTEHPSEGDLVVYYNYGIAHYGIYLSEGLIESKWGSGSVHRHPPFYVPSEYGNEIVFYKIKDGLTPKTMLEALQKETNYRCD